MVNPVIEFNFFEFEESMASMKAVKHHGSSPVSGGLPKIQQPKAGTKPASKKTVLKLQEPKKGPSQTFPTQLLFSLVVIMR